MNTAIRPAAARLLLAAAPLLFTASALAATRMEETRALAPGGRFVLNSDAGSVTVTGRAAGSTASGAHILVTSKTDDIQTRYDIRIEESAGLVKVTCRKKSSDWNPSNWMHGTSLHFDIQVPPETTVAVETGGGSIAASKLTKDANLSTSGGSIDVEDLDAALVANTSGGSISLARVDGDIKAGTSGGSIEVTEAGGLVDVETAGGSISVTFAEGNGKGGRIESSGGSIDVEVDPDAKLTINASTSGGSAGSDLPLANKRSSRTHVAGTLNGGGAPLEVHTSGGSVDVSGRDGR